MSCCGKKRIQFHEPNMIYRYNRETVNSVAQTKIARQFVVCFEYTGKTGLTVWGPISGRRYRFDRQGAHLVVDPRDRPSLTRVPKLRRC